MRNSHEVTVPNRQENEQSSELAMNSRTLEPSKESENSSLAAGEAPGRFQRVLDLVAGDEQRRFLTGSVLVPLVIALLTMSIGAFIASNYQDWQDRRARSRDIVDGIREATTNLSTNIEALAQQGSAVERIRSKQTVLSEIRAVDEALLHLKGRSSVLAKDHALALNSQVQGDLASSIDRCKQAMDIYADCLARTLSAPTPVESGQPCTTTFRADIAEAGSCKSLESTAHAIVY